MTVSRNTPGLLRRLAVTVAAGLLVLPAATATASTPSEVSDTVAVAAARTLITTKGIRHSYGGYSSVYDLYVGNIDRSKPVGVLFYFDADTSKPGNFRYLNTELMQRIADSAARRNLVLIAPHTPGGRGKYGLYNWWDNRNKAAYARNLADAAIARHGLDYSQVWLTGWSGGAQLITQELLAHRQSWLTGGGMIVMGGGEAEYGVSAPDRRVKNMKLRWYIGDRDGYGATVPKSWSAKVAAQRGLASYRAAGFSDAAMVTVANQGHYYDVASVIERGLAEYYRAPTPPAPKTKPGHPVRGDVVAINPGGGLVNYFGHAGRLSGPLQIGNGWASMISHHQVDWDRDGIMDVLAQSRDGKIFVYRGIAGGYDYPRQIGHGFGGYRILPLKMKTGRPYLLGIAPDGSMYRWTNTTDYRLIDRTQVGWGWGSMSSVVPIDWDGDGEDEVGAVSSVGDLWIYPTINARFDDVSSIIGYGWGHFRSVVSVPGLMGKNALIAKTGDGRLISYPFSGGRFPYGANQQIGQGWASYRIAGEQP